MLAYLHLLGRELLVSNLPDKRSRGSSGSLHIGTHIWLLDKIIQALLRKMVPLVGFWRGVGCDQTPSGLLVDVHALKRSPALEVQAHVAVPSVAQRAHEYLFYRYIHDLVRGRDDERGGGLTRLFQCRFSSRLSASSCSWPGLEFLLDRPLHRYSRL